MLLRRFTIKPIAQVRVRNFSVLLIFFFLLIFGYNHVPFLIKEEVQVYTKCLINFVGFFCILRHANLNKFTKLITFIS